jgi:hypothetical protein
MKAVKKMAEKSLIKCVGERGSVRMDARQNKEEGS